MVTPTHLVTHRHGWEAAIYIADSLQRQLISLDRYRRENAEHSVAISFREACKKKYPDFGLSYVDFGDLELKELHGAPEPGEDQVWIGDRWVPASVFGDVEPSCCDDDDCVVCDQGYHERCRKGCTIGR